MKNPKYSSVVLAERLSAGPFVSVSRLPTFVFLQSHRPCRKSQACGLPLLWFLPSKAFKSI